MRDLLALLLVATLGLGATLAYAVVAIVRQGAVDESRPADAIVVLGAAQYDGVPSAVFASRLQHAVELYHQGIAGILVVTGGKQPGDRFTEADTARTYAVAHGVPKSAILAENKGRNTLNYSDIMIVNVQNNNSHTGQFDNANAFPFSIDESRKYYDTTRLKTLGR